MKRMMASFSRATDSVRPTKSRHPEKSMLSPISEPQGFELGVGEAGRTGPSLSHTPHNILTLNYHLADGTKYRITNTRAAFGVERMQADGFILDPWSTRNKKKISPLAKSKDLTLSSFSSGTKRFNGDARSQSHRWSGHTRRMVIGSTRSRRTWECDGQSTSQTDRGAK